MPLWRHQACQIKQKKNCRLCFVDARKLEQETEVQHERNRGNLREVSWLILLTVQYYTSWLKELRLEETASVRKNLGDPISFSEKNKNPLRYCRWDTGRPRRARHRYSVSQTSHVLWNIEGYNFFSHYLANLEPSRFATTQDKLIMATVV